MSEGLAGHFVLELFCGADLEPLPESVVMTAEDSVDAALNGLDRKELVTAPLLHNEALFREFDAASATLLQNTFDAKPARRYELSL